MSEFNPETDLRLERLIKARPETIWRCWEEPELFKRWFTSPGVEVVEVDNDLTAGGRAYNVMRLPDGKLIPNDGCFLLAQPCQRLIFSDALRAGFRPGPDAGFMTADIRLELEDGGTLYAAHVMHTDAARCKSHEEMGFFDGWVTTLKQLDDLASTL